MSAREQFTAVRPPAAGMGQGRGGDEESPLALRMRQSRVIFWKNMKIYQRHPIATLMQLTAPFLIIMLLFVINAIIVATSTPDPDSLFVSHQEPIDDISVIPKCVTGTGQPQCTTLAYAPNTNADVNTIMNRVIAQSDTLEPADLVGYASAKAINDHLLANPNTTQNSVSFLAAGPDIFEYVVQVNGSLFSFGDGLGAQDIVRDEVLPLQIAVDNAILWFQLGQPADDIELLVTRTKFPHPSREGDSLVDSLFSLFFATSMIVSLVINMQYIIGEKEKKLRLVLRIFGLKDSVHWFTWFTIQVVVTMLSFLLVIIGGYILDLGFFVKNDFGTYGMLLFLYGLNLIAFTFFFASIFQTTRVSFFVGLVFLLFKITIAQIIELVVYDAGNASFISEDYRLGFSFVPPIMFWHGVNSLTAASNSDLKSGIRWADPGEGGTYIGNDQEHYSLTEVYARLTQTFFIIMFGAWYLDQVLPHNGSPLPAWFIFDPYYWFGVRVFKQQRVEGVPPPSLPKAPGEQDDADVAEERQQVESDKVPEDTGIKVQNLGKRFGIPGLTKQYIAVRNICFTVQRGRLFAFLGPNGAGKTTTINMLTGVLSATGGDAKILGNSIVHDLDAIRSNIGFCPQFDVLWRELTSGEHIELFARLKNWPEEKIESEIVERLSDVELLDVRNVRAGTYSGGMMRRLSVAISLTANPAVVFMDEPTTGMDPVSRRSVWNTMQRAKEGRVLILTTHSMEEADTLGDRICIIAKGRLRAIGSSLRLKNKFGAGYRITCLIGKVAAAEGTDEEAENHQRNAAVIKAIQSSIPNAAATHSTSGVVTMAVDRADSKKLPDTFKMLESSAKRLHITDISVSMTTLEEVFLRVAADAEEEAKRNMHVQQT